jgi:hypothetical protein
MKHEHFKEQEGPIMKPFEHALIKDSAYKCAQEIHKTLKFFTHDKSEVERIIKQDINKYLKGLQNADRN